MIPDLGLTTVMRTDVLAWLFFFFFLKWRSKNVKLQQVKVHCQSARPWQHFEHRTLSLLISNPYGRKTKSKAFVDRRCRAEVIAHWNSKNKETRGGEHFLKRCRPQLTLKCPFHGERVWAFGGVAAYCSRASHTASSSMDSYDEGPFNVSVMGGDIDEGITEANTRSVTWDPDANATKATQSYESDNSSHIKWIDESSCGDFLIDPREQSFFLCALFWQDWG